MKKSNSIKIFLADLDDIFDTALSVSLYNYINPALFKNSKIQTTSHDNLVYKKIKSFNNKNLINNHLTVNLVSIMESYLHNVLVEKIEKEPSRSIRFVENFNFQKSLTPKHVIEGPETLTIDTLRDIIYHNLPKVNALFKIIFEVDILSATNTDIQKIFTVINIRHKIVHTSSRVKQKKFYISTNTFIEFMDLIANWLLNIDSMIMNNSPRKRRRNYVLKYHSEISKYGSSPLLEKGVLEIAMNMFSEKNIFNSKEEIEL